VFDTEVRQEARGQPSLGRSGLARTAGMFFIRSYARDGAKSSGWAGESRESRANARICGWIGRPAAAWFGGAIGSRKLTKLTPRRDGVAPLGWRKMGSTLR